VDEPWQRKLLSCCIYRHSSWRRLRIETVRAGMRASERGKCRNRETETSGRGLGKYNSNTWDDSARRWYPPPFELKSRSISVACYRRRMCQLNMSQHGRGLVSRLQQQTCGVLEIQPKSWSVPIFLDVDGEIGGKSVFQQYKQYCQTPVRV
jgi:hypothetical protein